MSNSLMMMQSFLQTQYLALSQRHQREDMGFFAPGYKKLENREQRKKEVQEALEEITPTPQEKEVEGKEI